MEKWLRDKIARRQERAEDQGAEVISFREAQARNQERLRREAAERDRREVEPPPEKAS